MDHTPTSRTIEPAGRFDQACAALIGGGFTLPYVELWGEHEGRKAAKKAASKTKYTCPSCAANAWAKPETRLVCGECNEAMTAGPAEEEASPAVK